MLVPGCLSCVREHVAAPLWASDSFPIEWGECGVLGSSSETKPDMLSSKKMLAIIFTKI